MVSQPATSPDLYIPYTASSVMIDGNFSPAGKAMTGVRQRRSVMRATHGVEQAMVMRGSVQTARPFIFPATDPRRANCRGPMQRSSPIMGAWSFGTTAKTMPGRCRSCPIWTPYLMTAPRAAEQSRAEECHGKSRDQRALRLRRAGI